MQSNKVFGDKHSLQITKLEMAMTSCKVVYQCKKPFLCEFIYQILLETSAQEVQILM